MKRSFTPKPKPTRVKDPRVKDYVVNRRDGTCLYGLHHGGCSAGKDPHHIDTRGSGGGDTKENLITLCRKHHNEAHAGKITKEELRGILTLHYGYQYE